MEGFYRNKVFSDEEIEALKASAPKLAEELWIEADKQIHLDEKKQAEEFARMVKDPKSRAVFMTLTDQVFRMSRDAEVLNKFVNILVQHGVPSFFGFRDKTLLQSLKIFGPWLPSILSPPIVWMILAVMRYKTRNVIIQGEEKSLRLYIQSCKTAGLKINLNHLGDRVLGEREALRHLDDYISGLKNPGVSSVSVKISTLFSQADTVVRDHTISVVLDRLAALVKVGKEEERKSGIAKLVYLDMEEYKDLALTIEVFKRFLNNPELNRFSLGIALQAYIPDSFSYQRELTKLARIRKSNGGAPIRIRIVKGANLEMEKCIASLNGWAPAPYSTKLDTDANFKRMLEFAFHKENMDAVAIGVASHNIFEIAFAKKLQSLRDIKPDLIEYEMLEGIANHTRRSVQKIVGPVLTYSPVAGKGEFLNAIAYLVRRLVENTDEENFLSHSFQLTVDSPEWDLEKEKFLASLDHLSHLQLPLPRFRQNRNLETDCLPEPTIGIENYIPDCPTNFSLPANQDWLDKEILKSRNFSDDPIPLHIGSKVIHKKRELMLSRDLSRSGKAATCFSAANSDDIDYAIRFACESENSRWDNDADYREKIFEKAALELNKNRASLIAVGMKEISKGIAELDMEVSEAIDFVKYYPNALKYFHDNYPNLIFDKKGIVLVISPWNFPIAIPAGGIVASLAGGNRVIIKPSPHSLKSTWEVVKLFWKAGVPSSALQYIPCQDDVASFLTQNPKIDQVLFTGSAGTADKILVGRPGLELSGETSGKNAFIITDSADMELAIEHLVESAFAYNGQKCSAASIAILTKEVFNDPKFKRQLKDAVESLPVGELGSKPYSKISPLIMPPKKDLQRAFTELEPEEEWLVQPKRYPADNLWSPAVKWNVRPGGFTHLTEFFGPVLGVMQAKDIKQACEFANQTQYGLTAGLHSLDDRERDYFLEAMKAGNLYVNNKTTGAIVGRQPFGGLKNSRRGSGGKAGGPNYILQFMKVREAGKPKFSKNFTNPLSELFGLWQKTNWSQIECFSEFAFEVNQALQGALSCSFQYDEYFSKEHSKSKAQAVIGQENIFRYRRAGNFTIRVAEGDALSDILLRLFAGLIAGNSVAVSFPKEMSSGKFVEFLKSHFLESVKNLFSLFIEKDEELQSRILEKSIDRLAYTHSDKIPEFIFEAAIEVNLPILRQKPLTEGRILLLEQFDEQSITNTFHRYGNLGLKGLE